VFVVVPPAAIRQLDAAASLHVWNEATSELRLVCSFQTSQEEVDDFVALARKLASA
jgi:threonine aldolase